MYRVNILWIFQVAFKINSVINQFNKEEDMVDNILNLRPIRWKVRFIETTKLTELDAKRFPMTV